MNNKEFAEELITRFAGYHAPVRFMVQEAAKKILRMDETIDYARTIQAEGVLLKAELESLKNSYEQLQEINDRTFQSDLTMGLDLEKVKTERDAMAAYLKRIYSCSCCKHEHCDVDAEPCGSCMEGENFPAWEWEGE